MKRLFLLAMLILASLSTHAQHFDWVGTALVAYPNPFRQSVKIRVES